MAKKNIGKIAKTWLGWTGFAFLLITLLKLMFNWNLSAYFTAFVMIPFGLVLLFQGITGKGKEIKFFIHKASIVFGAGLVLLGILSIPALSGIVIPNMKEFSLTFLTGGLILTLIEIKV